MEEYASYKERTKMFIPFILGKVVILFLNNPCNCTSSLSKLFKKGDSLLLFINKLFPEFL